MKFKDKHIFGTRHEKGFDWLTYGDFKDQVDTFRKVLHLHKIGKGDKVIDRIIFLIHIF